MQSEQSTDFIHMRTLKVPNFVQIARSKNVYIGKVFNPAVVSWTQRKRTFPKFFQCNFSHRRLLDAAKPNKPRVFHVQIRSPFAGGISASISAKGPTLCTCRGAQVPAQCVVGIGLLVCEHGVRAGVDDCGNKKDMAVGWK